jgi:hypothetical protein
MKREKWGLLAEAIEVMRSLPSQPAHARSSQMSHLMAVRPEGANQLWRKNPSRKLLIVLEANERSAG